MLDIKFIRENSEKVKTASENKGTKVDIEEVLKPKLYIRESSQRIAPKNGRFK